MNKSSKIESLNGVRGIAILFVLLSHSSNRGIVLNEHLDFSGSGRYGVFLFFVLSAFLLTRQFIISGKNTANIKNTLSDYAIRRILRIYPLYISALITYHLLDKVNLSAYRFNTHEILSSILLLDAKGIFWTIPVEFQYYFILPAVSYALIFSRNTTLTLLTIFFFTITWWSIFIPEYTTNIIPFLPIFIIGSGIAYISCSLDERLGEDRKFRYLDFVSACAILAFIILIPSAFNFLFGTNVPTDAFHNDFLLFSILSGTLVLSISHSKGIIENIISSRFFTFWGDISFSAYLGHMLVLLAIDHADLPSAIKLLLFLSVTAALSYLTFRYFELPLSKASNVRLAYNNCRIYLSKK